MKNSEFIIRGKLTNVFHQQTFGKGFRKREFIVETDEDTPQKIAFTLTQQNCELINEYAVGDTIDVYFEVKGREWNGRFFNTLEATKLDGESSVDRSETEDDLTDIFQDPDLFPQNVPKEIPTAASLDDDLPF